ncbi:FkbM family methyltransferase [Prosthecobacter sp.]|uniref:FkbM family methyltransferase n=1 Tax=Prosthecobacter sp. TaxID=1965333 RepID=UPI0037849E9C
MPTDSHTATGKGLLSAVPPSWITWIYTVLLRPKPLRMLAQWAVRTLFIKKEVQVHGVRLALNPQDAIVSGALSLGCYETSLSELFRATIKPGMNVLDIGANIGLYSMIAANEAGPTGRVVAVEPEAGNCAFVERSRQLNGFENIAIINKAASDREGTLNLYLCAENKADHRVYDAGGDRPHVKVQATSIDFLLQEQGVTRLDVIKIDVQGAEYQVFVGMQKTLQSQPNLTIFMEFWPWGLLQSGSDPQKLLDLLVQAGFSMGEFDDTTAQVKPIADLAALAAHKLEREHFNLVLTKGAKPAASAQ